MPILPNSTLEKLIQTHLELYRGTAMAQPTQMVLKWIPLSIKLPTLVLRELKHNWEGYFRGKEKLGQVEGWFSQAFHLVESGGGAYGLEEGPTVGQFPSFDVRMISDSSLFPFLYLPYHIFNSTINSVSAHLELEWSLVIFSVWLTPYLPSPLLTFYRSMIGVPSDLMSRTNLLVTLKERPLLGVLSQGTMLVLLWVCFVLPSPSNIGVLKLYFFDQRSVLLFAFVNANFSCPLFIPKARRYSNCCSLRQVSSLPSSHGFGRFY